VDYIPGRYPLPNAEAFTKVCFEIGGHGAFGGTDRMTQTRSKIPIRLRSFHATKTWELKTAAAMSCSGAGIN